jgi:hypothetical protein
LQTFKNPKGALLEALRESGSVPGDENGRKRAEEPAKKKQRRPDKGVLPAPSRLDPLRRQIS